jgi:plastocyanin
MENLARVILAASVIAACHAAEIQGNVIVERKLTKRTVTPAAGLYQRGVAVDLGNDAAQDPLAYERTHVVIYLEGQPAASLQTKVATIEQRDRRFVPDLVVIPAGSSVVFPNFDPIFHNVFSLSKPKTFDLGNYPKGQSRTVAFAKPGPVFVYCHLHPNMSASVIVTPNQWSTIADASGRFALPDVPPGTYTIVAWHKTAGTFRQTVKVGENGFSGITFNIPLPAEEPKVTSENHQH